MKLRAGINKLILLCALLFVAAANTSYAQQGGIGGGIYGLKIPSGTVLSGDGKALSVATTTGTGTTVVLSGTPTLVTPIIGAATGISTSLTDGSYTAVTQGSASVPFSYVSNNAGTFGVGHFYDGDYKIVARSGSGTWNERLKLGRDDGLLQLLSYTTAGILSNDASGNIISVAAIKTGTTGSIGGGALLAGACASGTVSVTGATTTMTVSVSPNTYPGDGSSFFGYVSSAGTVTVKVCAIVALTPSAGTYNVRVIP